MWLLTTRVKKETKLGKSYKLLLHDLTNICTSIKLNDVCCDWTFSLRRVRKADLHFWSRGGAAQSRMP